MRFYPLELLVMLAAVLYESITMKLVCKLAECFPIFEMTGREQAVTHLFVFVELITIAEAPASSA